MQRQRQQHPRPSHGSPSVAKKIQMFEEGEGGEGARHEQEAIVQEFRHLHINRSGMEEETETGQSRGPSVPRPVDEDGLILPKKVLNPCMESKEVKDLNKEIRWNNRAGVNVLGGKSELEKALDKRKWQRVEQEKRMESEAAKTDFQKVLEERAKRIEVEKKEDQIIGGGGDSGHCSPEPEFLRVQLKSSGGGGGGGKVHQGKVVSLT